VKRAPAGNATLTVVVAPAPATTSRVSAQSPGAHSGQLPSVPVR